MTFSYGSHMSEHTKTIWEATSSPMTVQKPWNDSFFAHPEQAGDAQIDLGNQRRVLVPLGVLDFVDPGGVKLTEQRRRLG